MYLLLKKFIDNKLIAKLGIIFKALAQLIFVEKIIEYFMLPYYLDNKFILASILIILSANVVAFYI